MHFKIIWLSDNWNDFMVVWFCEISLSILLSSILTSFPEFKLKWKSIKHEKLKDIKRIVHLFWQYSTVQWSVPAHRSTVDNQWVKSDYVKCRRRKAEFLPNIPDLTPESPGRPLMSKLRYFPRWLSRSVVLTCLCQWSIS